MAAPFLLAAVAVVVLWAATRTWRRTQPVMIPEDIEEATQLGRTRTRQVVLGTVAIVAVAVVMDVVQDIRDGGDYGSAASQGPTTVTISAPATLDDYQLMTGATADQLQSEVAARTSGQQVVNFYTTSGDPTRPVLVAMTDTSALDARLASDLDQYSADYENTQFLAGAGVTDAKVLPLGSDGEMQCGQNSTEEVCTWTDAGSEGSLTTTRISNIDMDQLTTLTMAFRSSAEH
ncbi:hypothetical protein SAMN05414137_101390 [Streptacidiphilus jiangxiensis]|uniref:Uncharacterized protein n=2 Tax=Streptacidiphilus jiangxiensis TaxID=235985 RepID=A0A1H7FSZ0_STRJI|nr:hypothetical protein SAMN05414137_101390 [Streptacidiphilus jiangxiensis]